MKLALVADGASSNNGGPCGAGYILYDGESGEKLDFQSKYIGEGTSTFAECKAMADAIVWFIGYVQSIENNLMGDEVMIELSILSDSALVIKMMKGEAQPRKDTTKQWMNEVMTNLNRLKTHEVIKEIEIKHIGRTYSQDVDYLAQSAAQDQVRRNTEAEFPFLSPTYKK